MTHSQLLPTTQAQFGPQSHATPHWQLGAAADGRDSHPQVQVAPAQDAQVQALEAFDVLNIVDSSRESRLTWLHEEVCINSASWS